MKRRIVLCAVGLMAFGYEGGVPSFGSFDLNRVLSELEKKEHAIRAIKFNFQQDVSFRQINTQATVSGEALFAKPDKLHITKQYPDKQVTVSDGKKVWVYNPAYNQVWEGAAKQWLQSTALPKGLVPVDHYVADLKENFVLKLASQAPEGQQTVRIDATPKNKALGYRLAISVSTASWLPTETTYESESAKVVTRWSNPEVNLVLSGDEFKFSPPQGADVIPLN